MRAVTSGRAHQMDDDVGDPDVEDDIAEGQHLGQRRHREDVGEEHEPVGRALEVALASHTQVVDLFGLSDPGRHQRRRTHGHPPVDRDDEEVQGDAQSNQPHGDEGRVAGREGEQQQIGKEEEDQADGGVDPCTHRLEGDSAHEQGE